MGSRPRKKQAVIKTYNAATKALIYKNAATSPLLRLPSEIRQNVLLNLVGNNLIHIKYRYAKKLHHAICQASQSEQCAYDEATTSKVKDPAAGSHITPCSQRHGACYMCGGDDSSIYRSPSGRYPSGWAGIKHVDLGVLGVCRQLYEEANHLLWATNIFSFDDPLSFIQFFNTLNAAQKHNISNLHLSAYLGSGRYPDEHLSYYHDWTRALKPHLLNTLRSVQDLHVCFEQGELYNHHGLTLTPDDKKRFLDNTVKVFLSLRALPAKNVTVMVTNGKDGTEYNQGAIIPKWTLTQKLNYAEQIRTQLADPHGAEDLAYEEKERIARAKKKTLKYAEAKASVAKQRAKQHQNDTDRREERASAAEDRADWARVRALNAAPKNKDRLQDVYERKNDYARRLRAVATESAYKSARSKASAKSQIAKYERAKARVEDYLSKAAAKGSEGNVGNNQEDESNKEESEEERNDRESYSPDL